MTTNLPAIEDLTEVTTQELMDSIQKFPETLKKLEDSIREKRNIINNHRAAINAEYDAIGDIEVAMVTLRDAYVVATQQLAIRFSKSVQAACSHGIKGVGRYVTVGELVEAKCYDNAKLRA